MKRLFTILMMAAMVAVSCSEATTSEIDNSPKIEFEDSKAFMKCIVNWDKNHDGQFSEAEAAAVTSLGEVFSWCEMESFDELKYFTGITAIEDDAFYYCSNLKSIPIPANVTTIGKRAFANCSDLKSVYCLIATPPTLGEGAFDDNDMSRKIYVPTASVSAYKAAWNQYATAIVGYGNSTSAPLERIELSAQTTTIAPGKSLQITVTYYPENAAKPELYWKSSNHDVALVGMNGKVTAFEVGTATITAYTYDEKISASIDITVADNITFADSEVKRLCVNNWDTDEDGEISFNEAAVVTDLGRRFFNKGIITSFNELQYFTALKTIGESSFYYCEKLTSITLPNSVTNIGDDAFYYCKSLTSITIPNSVTNIGNYAFDSCSSITSITIPDSVESIGRNICGECRNLSAIYGKFASDDNRCLIVDGVLNSVAPAGLTEFVIPSGVTEIGAYTFYNLTNFTSITIPDGVTEIGGLAFYGCSSLKEVYCRPTTPPAGGPEMFNSNASDRKIYVPTASVEAYKSASYWSTYADAIVGYDF